MKTLQTKYLDAFGTMHSLTDENGRLEDEIKNLSLRILKLEGAIADILAEGSYRFLYRSSAHVVDFPKQPFLPWTVQRCMIGCWSSRGSILIVSTRVSFFNSSDGFGIGYSWWCTLVSRDNDDL